MMYKQSLSFLDVNNFINKTPSSNKAVGSLALLDLQLFACWSLSKGTQGIVQAYDKGWEVDNSRPGEAGTIAMPLFYL